MKRSFIALSAAAGLGMALVLAGCAKKDDKPQEDVSAAQHENHDQGTAYGIGEAAGSAVQSSEDAATRLREAGHEAAADVRNAAGEAKQAGKDAAENMKQGYQEGRQQQ